MNKKFIAIAAALISCLARAGSDDNMPIADVTESPGQFLMKNYGWTFDTTKWKLKCSLSGAFPANEVKKNGKNPETDISCFQKEKSFWLGVVWNVPARTVEEAEEVTYRGISKPLKWEASWNSSLYPSAITPSGILNDSVVTVKDVGAFWNKKTVLTPVSFYHFKIRMKNDRFFIDDEGQRENYLAFTIVLQGDLFDAQEKLDSIWTRRTIREIVDSIRVEN